MLPCWSKTLYCTLFRFGCPQHHLQHVSFPVPQLQQPVGWRFWHRVQAEALYSYRLLLPGPLLLEKVHTLFLILWPTLKEEYFSGFWISILCLGVKKSSPSFPQAKDLLWHRLQGAVWGGDHRPSVIQALLQLQAAEDAGAHAGGAMPPRHAPPGASRGAEGGLVTLLSFILTPTGLSVAPRFVSSGRLLPHQINFQCEREVWSTPLAGSLFLFVFALCIELTYFFDYDCFFFYIYI